MRKKLEYQIKVNGKTVWKGTDPTTELFDKIRKKNPGKEVGIAVDPGEEILIAIVK